MQPIVENSKRELAELCRRFHVQRLEVFGSAARGAFDATRSDVDFIVEFERNSPMKALDSYFGLKEALEALFARPVDLVMSGAIENPFLKASIEQSRETVYAA
jgi:predicted nucleotidyltransferase